MTALGFLVYAFTVASSLVYYNDNECIFPLFSRAYITATTFLPERGPYNTIGYMEIPRGYQNLAVTINILLWSWTDMRYAAFP
ncbi:hypothetical protein ALC57_00032 [Trachymyrmex cornetzi]|uniref:Uncharacterized protein n=1 Tax=Trachymyrmex cornetzi TaxID=471704 RepID=A0A151K2P7_9HYME|nr:hypothetical protein ALC57_07440 [Trachymyrmex cornetzi]KYN50395.1 hypothetical protein ALC57_00032 [Trachymyrmex cornetzi]